MSPFQDVIAAPPGSPVPYVALAYGLVWVVLLAFLVALWRRQGRVASELEDLRAEIQAAEERDRGPRG